MLPDREYQLLLESNDLAGRNTLERERLEIGEDRFLSRLAVLFTRSRSSELCQRAWNAVGDFRSDNINELKGTPLEDWKNAINAVMSDVDPVLRRTAVDCLLDSEIEFTQLFIDSLIDILRDPCESVRLAARTVLGKVGYQAVPKLLSSLCDAPFHLPHPDDEQNCSSLWDIFSTIDTIVGNSYSKLSPEERVVYSRAAGDTAKQLLSGAKTQETLRSIKSSMEILNIIEKDADMRFSTEERGVRDICVKTIGSFLKGILPEQPYCYWDIWKAGDTLGDHLGGECALQEIEGLLGATDERVKRSIAHALGHIASEKSLKMLHILSDDDSVDVRNEAIKATTALHRRLGRS